MNADEAADVAVIGGGIQGAAVAEEAAAHGFKVVLLERRHPAYGTSSRSSKLIHGGLRYLETGQLRLVRECLRERSILLRRAPELVRLQTFLIPIFANTRRRPWQIRSGLSLYALLAGFGAGSGFGSTDPKRWSNPDGLNTQHLQGLFHYHDGQTDDAALTRAVLDSAQRLGADLRFPAEFTSAARETGGWLLRYESNGDAQSLRARVLVNAGGPWVNRILARIEHAPAPLPVEWVQGTHIILQGRLKAGAYYVEAEDGRAVFVMPWGEHTLVGTTETVFDGEPDRVAPLQTEINYLLRTFRHHFPGRANARMLDAFAGLRVLPAAEGNPFGRPRETQLVVDNRLRPRVLSIYGGKLTAARATAAQAVHQLLPGLPKRQPVADTRKLLLNPTAKQDIVTGLQS